MEASIIIRVKNEKENLEKLLGILKTQTYQDFEIIIVDNNSTDGSDKIVFDYFSKNRIQIVKIDKFTYPKACNLGAERAKGKYLVYISAHSFPGSKFWLEDGLSNFTNDKIAGVFAFPVAGKYGSIWEKLGSLPNYIKKNGHIGNTNSIIRKYLWENHKFDESLIFGSEDYEWSKYWSLNGYKIVNDKKFRVEHAHNIGLKMIIERHKSWRDQRKLIDEKLSNT